MVLPGRSRRLAVALALALAGCGDDGEGLADGGSADAAVDAGVADGAADGRPDGADDAALAQRCEAEIELGMAMGVGVYAGTTAGGDDDVTPECASASQAGASDVVFRWQAPAAGIYVMDTFGSTFDTVLHVRDATCALLACSDDTANPSVLSRVAVDLAAGQAVFVVVDGLRGQEGDFQLSITQPPTSELECQDGLDDDRDALADCADPDCLVVETCHERVCDDGLDNDGDVAADCGDLDCAGSEPCVETVCDDGIDADADGFTDCADLSCATSEPCIETVCDDGLDADLDGVSDCADSDCRCAVSCLAIDPCPRRDLGTALGTPVARGTTVGECDARQAQDCSPLPLAVGVGPEVTLRWTAPSSGGFVFDTIGSDFNTALYLLDGSCTGAQLACNDDLLPGVLRSRLEVSLSAGQTVIVVLDGASVADAGGYVLNIVPF